MDNTLTPEFQNAFDRIGREISALRAEIKKQSAPPEKDYYRPSEVCQLLSISRSKFETLKNQGVFATRKVGGSIYVAAKDLQKYLPKSK